ncbi:MAG: coproporphyrinogen dehydrogenase HemZ [Firmicutes bacterium]|nr:coproporphyrinogen dehydrogenase HemZ [Bacillota bacterium]
MKITCFLIGHNFVNEVQAITQVFFANAKFAFLSDVDFTNGENYPETYQEKIPQSGFAVAGIITETSCTGEFYQNGKISATKTVNLDKHDKYGKNGENAKESNFQNKLTKTLKRNLMLALFYALQTALKREIPWGALTGVRPAKQVRLWLQAGETAETITQRLSQIYKCRSDKIDLAIKVAQAEERLLSQHKIGESIGLYVGVPFCPSRCLYCSFVVSQKPKADAHSRYLSALSAEVKLQHNNILAENPINSIYLGGGTPTAFSAHDLEILLKIIQPYNNGKIEYTVEAGRPDSITQEKLDVLKYYGVTRIAINPQTLNDVTLQKIGRLHTVADFYKAYEMAVNTGFDNINTDIIVGLPNETFADVQNTMNQLKKLAPAHVTVHTLAVKRASRLNENIQEYEIAEKTVDKMLAIAQETCENMGLSPYYMYRQKNMIGNFENVGYSKFGNESIYNIAMMAETQTVIGLGAGAVTKILTLANSKIERKFNPKDTETYIERMNQL